MNPRELRFWVVLGTGVAGWAIACGSINPYPPDDPNGPYQAGKQVGGVASGGGGSAGEATEGGVLFEGGIPLPEGGGGTSGSGGVALCPGLLCTKLATATVSAPQTIALDKTTVYWTNATTSGSPGAGSVQSVPRAGGTAATVAGSQTAPSFIASGSGFIAWSTLGSGGLPGAGTVQLLDVSPLGSIQTPGTALSIPEGIAIDASNVYFTTSESNSTVIEAASLSGGAAVTLGVAMGVAAPGAMVLNGSTLYLAAWNTPAGNGGAILSMPTSGGTPTVIQTLPPGTTGSLPNGIATDGTNVYWTDLLAGGVFSSAISGGTVSTIISGLPTPSPFWLATDSKNLYFADFHGQNLYEMPFSTPGTLIVLSSGLPNPSAIAADDNDNFVYFGTDLAIWAIAKK